MGTKDKYEKIDKIIGAFAVLLGVEKSELIRGLVGVATQKLKCPRCSQRPLKELQREQLKRGRKGAQWVTYECAGCGLRKIKPGAGFTPPKGWKYRADTADWLCPKCSKLESYRRKEK